MSTSISLGDLGTAIINDKNIAVYPTQTNNAGKFLSTDGTTTSWADGGGNTDGFLSGLTVSGSGSNGLDLAFTRNNDTNINFSIPKYTIHTTAFNDGTLTIQQFHNNDKTVDILPTQSSNSGKFLTTDGTNLNWGDAGGGGAPSTTPLPAYTFDSNGPTNTGLNGVGIGYRHNKWCVWDDGFLSHVSSASTGVPYPHYESLATFLNGIRSDSGNGSMWINAVVGSSMYFQNDEGIAYPFTKLTINSHTTYPHTLNIRFMIGGSNDGIQWTWFAAFDNQNTNGWVTPISGVSIGSCGNFDNTSTSLYTPNTISGVTGQGYSLTYHFSNTTGYLRYRIKYIDGGTSLSTKDGIDYYNFVEIAEIEWG